MGERVEQKYPLPLPDPERLYPPVLKDWFASQSEEHQLKLRETAVQLALSSGTDDVQEALRTLVAVNKVYREAQRHPPIYDLR